MLTGGYEFPEPEVLYSARITIEPGLFSGFQKSVYDYTARNHGVPRKMICIDPVRRIKEKYTFYVHSPIR